MSVKHAIKNTSKHLVKWTSESTKARCTWRKGHNALTNDVGISLLQAQERWQTSSVAEDKGGSQGPKKKGSATSNFTPKTNVSSEK